MFRMRPIGRVHTGTLGRYLNFTKQEPTNGFSVHDITLIARVRGKLLAERLPSIGAPAKYLDRNTDEDSGAYCKDPNHVHRD